MEEIVVKLDAKNLISEMEKAKIQVLGANTIGTIGTIAPRKRSFVSLIDIEIMKLRKNAKMPTYEYSNFANSGMDLYVAAVAFRENGEWKEYAGGDIAPGETVLVKTGFAMAIPEGLELQIRPTSGNSLKTKMRVANSPGTIDASYRGEIGIIIENIGDINITLHEGAKVAQGVLCPVYHAEFKIVDSLDETVRGKSGYGSTGTI